MAEAMRGATRASSAWNPGVQRLTWATGNGIDESRAATACHPEDHERVREGELDDGHEGRDDVRYH